MVDFQTGERLQAADRQSWWKEGKNQAHESVFAALDFLDTHQGHRLEANIRHARLYGNLPLFGLTPGAFATATSQTRVVRLNVVQSMIDTATNNIGKERPRPLFLTEGGDYRLRRHAKNLSKLNLGVFDQNRVYEKAPCVFRDGGIFGFGAFKQFLDGDKIRCERIFPDELRWDEADAVYGSPRQMFQRRFVAREVALANWPSKATLIKEAPKPNPMDGSVSSYQLLADHIEIVEAWHLPSGDPETATDGRRVICFRSGTVLDESWKKPHFPFAFFHWSDPVLGLAGSGLAELLTGIQVAINFHLDTMEKALRRVAVPRIFIDDASEVNLDHINDLVGAFVTYAHGTTPPQISTPSVIPPDFQQHLQFLIDQAYQIAGITQLAAGGGKPEGLNSGRALREFTDIASLRFAVVQRNYENMFLEMARQIVSLAYDLRAQERDLEVHVKNGRRFWEKIRFDDIELEPNQFEMSVFPTSMLPKTPAARYATVQEWIADGTVTREEGMQLLDMPDLDAASTHITAALDDIDDLIDRFLYEDVELSADEKGLPEAEREVLEAERVYLPPDPMQNLQLGARRMNGAFLRARLEGVPEVRRELLSRWIADAEALMAPPEQAQMAQAGAVPPDAVPPGGPPIPAPPPAAV